MAEITLSSVGALPPREPPEPGRRRVAWVRARHMLWAPVLAAAIVTGVAAGTPHLRVVSTYSGPSAAPFYRRCDYVGLSSRRVIPADGRCPLIRLLTSRTER